MPNWCYNEVTIISPTKNLHKAILRDVAYDREGKKKDLELESWLEDYMLGTVRYIPTFQKLAPCKTKDGEYTSPGLGDGTYWGTKRDMCGQDMDVDDRRIRISFDTAWGPPDIWFRKLCDKYPSASLSMYSEEPGDNFEIMQGHEMDGVFYYNESHYRHECEHCGYKDENNEYIDELEGYYCNSCGEELLAANENKDEHKSTSNC